MKKYVMIGHNHLFGDLIEIIHANGGLLQKIVQNIPEPVHPNRPSLQERLARLQDPNFNREGINQFYPIAIESLETFVPQENECYVIGFTGFKQANLRRDLESKFGIQFESLIHPTAIISPTAQISSGAIINMGVIIGSGASIGEHVFINKGAIVGHDTVLDSYAIVQPGAKIAGHVKIGCGAFIGIGSVVIEDTSIGPYSMVAAGAIVIDDVSPHVLVAGIPAVYKKNMALS